MKKRTVAGITFLLIFAMLPLLSGCHKEVIPAGDKLYPYRTLEESCSEAVTILYGTVGSTNGGTWIHKAVASDGTVIEEAFTKTTLQVKQVLKHGDQKIGAAYRFNAPGGETFSKIFLSDYQFNVGDEVILLLNQHDIPLGGDIYWITDGRLHIEQSKLPQSIQAAIPSTNRGIASLSTKEFLSMISNLV